MKKFVLIGALVIHAIAASSSTLTIINDGFTFTPAEIAIDFGDTVLFQLGSIHNAVEVDEATWNANGNSPAEGGFAVPFGGGTVTGLTPGIHFYVCTPHASGGMKGKILVNGASGISQNEKLDKYFKLYPNPAKSIIIIERKGNPAAIDNIPGKVSTIAIFNATGEQVYLTESFDPLKSRKLDLSGLTSGSYIIRIRDDEKVYSGPFIKE